MSEKIECTKNGRKRNGKQNTIKIKLQGRSKTTNVPVDNFLTVFCKGKVQTYNINIL